MQRLIHKLYLYLKIYPRTSLILFIVLGMHVTLLFYIPSYKYPAKISPPQHAKVKTIVYLPPPKKITPTQQAKQPSAAEPKKKQQKSSTPKKQKNFDQKKLALMQKKLQTTPPPSKSYKGESLILPKKIAPYPSLQENETKEDFFANSLISYLKKSLKLPEYGKVKVKIIFNSKGKICELVILESESKHNEKYLLETLPKLTLPQTKEPQSLLITFCNN